MAIRTILEAPDPRLKTVSVPVEKFDDELKMLVADMFETMYAAPGIGLAAIQLGVPLRLVVIDLQEPDLEARASSCDDDACEHDHRPVIKAPRALINPQIFDPSEEMSVYSEGCLSLPDIYAEVERPSQVRLIWQDVDGARHEEWVDGLLATCIQHEIDHLEGILFIDHLSRLKRNMAIKRLEKARRTA